MSKLAAPAVQVDSWKHWSMGEGLKKCRRTAPEGCAVVVDGDELYYQEMSSGREFALQPLEPDAQAWFDANRDDLRGGKNWQRRRTEQLAGKGQPGTQSGPFSYSGHLYDNSNGLNYQPPQRISYMAAFLGVSRLSSTNNVELAIWPGIQPLDSSMVLQPLLQRDHPAPTNQWYMIPTINAFGRQITGGQFPIIMPQGIWGVIREYGSQGYWEVGYFRGNRGNTGPALGNPVSGSTPLNVLFKDPRWAPGGSIIDITRFKWGEAVVSIEIPDADGNAFPWMCSDINIQAVWGGITVQQGSFKLPVFWQNGNNILAQNSIGCSFAQSVQSGQSNGSAQITATYGNP